MSDTRIWYIVKKPNDTFAPSDLRRDAAAAWEHWLRLHPAYHNHHDTRRAAQTAANLEGVRLCTVVTQETGVVSGTGLER